MILEDLEFMLFHRKIKWLTGREQKTDADAYIADSDNVTSATNEYGTGTLATTAIAIDIPVWAIPGAAWLNTTPTTPVLVSTPIAISLQAAYGVAHKLLDDLSVLLQQIEAENRYPSVDVTLGHDTIYGLRQGLYIAHNYSHDTILQSPAQEIAFLQASAAGPTGGNYDGNDPETFFEDAATLTGNDRVIGGALSVVNLNDFSRKTMRELITQGIQDANNPLPTRAQFMRGRWWESITE